MVKGRQRLPHHGPQTAEHRTLGRAEERVVQVRTLLLPLGCRPASALVQAANSIRTELRVTQACSITLVYADAHASAPARSRRGVRTKLECVEALDVCIHTADCDSVNQAAEPLLGQARMLYECSGDEPAGRGRFIRVLRVVRGSEAHLPCGRLSAGN
jgi:hypothetical protein